MNTKEARGHFSDLLKRVAAGDEVVITCRGKEIARMLPPEVKKPFPDLTAFRASIKAKGEPLSQTIIKMRREARY